MVAPDLQGPAQPRGTPPGPLHWRLRDQSPCRGIFSASSTPLWPQLFTTQDLGIAIVYTLMNPHPCAHAHTTHTHSPRRSRCLSSFLLCIPQGLAHSRCLNKQEQSRQPWLLWVLQGFFGFLQSWGPSPGWRQGSKCSPQHPHSVPPKLSHPSAGNHMETAAQKKSRS